MYSGYLAMGGQIVDATIVAAPKQRNTHAEKADIKAGKVPDAWKDKPAKLRQKDRDARWTVKFSKAKVAEDGKAQQRDIAIPAFGYKNHASIDRRHGFIRGWNVTSASAYDGAQLRNVLDRGNTGSTVWADTAYRSKTNEEWLEKNGYVSDIHHKKPKGRPMSDSAGLSPTIVIVVVVAGIAVWVLVNRTAFGLLSGLVGRNPVVMRWQGANLQGIGLASFAVAGALAGLAASLEFLGPNGRIVRGFLPAHGITAFWWRWSPGCRSARRPSSRCSSAASPRPRSTCR